MFRSILMFLNKIFAEFPKIVEPSEAIFLLKSSSSLSFDPMKIVKELSIVTAEALEPIRFSKTLLKKNEA